MISSVLSPKIKYLVSLGMRSFFRESPSVARCMVFSFGFEELPTSHYYILLHDLRNHFPKLIDKLRRFESRIKESCPRYSELLYRITRIVYEKAKQTADISDKDIVTEIVVMSLVGYDDGGYPNDKRFLEKKMYSNVKDFIEVRPINEPLRPKSLSNNRLRNLTGPKQHPLL